MSKFNAQLTKLLQLLGTMFLDALQTLPAVPPCSLRTAESKSRLNYTPTANKRERWNNR